MQMQNENAESVVVFCTCLLNVTLHMSLVFVNVRINYDVLLVGGISEVEILSRFCYRGWLIMIFFEIVRRIIGMMRMRKRLLLHHPHRRWSFLRRIRTRQRVK